MAWYLVQIASSSTANMRWNFIFFLLLIAAHHSRAVPKEDTSKRDTLFRYSWLLAGKGKWIYRQHDAKEMILKLLFMGGIELQPGPADHVENRKAVCAVCLLKAHKTKSGYRQVNAHQEEMIKEKVSKVYDRENLTLPTGLCNPCRCKLERDYKCKRYPDYSKIFKNGSLKVIRNLRVYQIIHHMPAENLRWKRLL